MAPRGHWAGEPPVRRRDCAQSLRADTQRTDMHRLRIAHQRKSVFSRLTVSIPSSILLYNCRGRLPRVVLRVTSVGVRREAETDSNLTRVGGVEHEQQWPQHGTLREVTEEKTDGRKDPIEEHHLSAIAEIRAIPISSTIERIPHVTEKCSARTSWSTVSKAVEMSSRPCRAWSPASIALVRSVTTSKQFKRAVSVE